MSSDGLFTKAKSKLSELFKEKKETSELEMARDEDSHYRSDIRSRTETWFIHQSSSLRDISEMKFEELTRKYNNLENIKRYIEIHEEIEKEFEDKKPKTFVQKTRNKISNGVSKVKSVFSRKQKQTKSK